MNIYKKKRHYERLGDNSPILWAYFNTSEYYPSQLTNYGQEGLSFKSDICLKPGTNIFVKFDLRMKPAEVRWCRESDDNESFEIGVRYHGLYDY
jgi:hypothetical protein